jgi:aminopeptidase YwaD
MIRESASNTRMKSYCPILVAMCPWLIFLAVAAASGTQRGHMESKSQAGVTGGASRTGPRVCSACIRAHMEFLASDALHGRGSGTADELVAATYAASQMRAYGLVPAGDNGGYIQRAGMEQPKLIAPPQLTFAKPGANAAGEQITWTYGKEFIARSLSQTHFSGRLRVINADEYDPGVAGSVVLILGSDWAKLRAKAASVTSAGAVAALVTASAEHAAQFEEIARQLPDLPAKIDGRNASGLRDFTLLEISPDAANLLKALPENTTLTFTSSATNEQKYAWNALGMLRGSDPNLKHAVVLLSAHLDHLGVGKPVNGDSIYNGADDDASGTTAVLELARALGSGPPPKRTVVFALFGSEELGGLGSAYFREHPPLPLQHIAVNLEFEMLGRADPAVKSDTVWLTGWERSNLGPELAARGAKLVGDPHPKNNFFARSDNYVLAKKGVVAQTVSSYGLHSDYHQPSDDLAHIDFKHMDAAIGSLLLPLQWLVNSDFRPEWKAGGRP